MRRFPKAKWTLPDIVDPPGRKLIMLCIPDEKYHIAAFRGAMLALASAYNWADDPLHTAKDVAQVWRSVIDDEGNCVEFRQDDCHLYLVMNGIETLIYNGQECIDANIADGTIKPGIANGGLGPKGIAECYPYSMELSPLESYYLPQVVNTGDTLQFIDFSGGTSDVIGGNVLWYCPTGATYVLGACSGARGGAVVGDPAQSITHASLIVQINNVYYDLFNVSSVPQTFVVPAGITNQLCKVQLNYGAITGASATGTVKATIQWCRNSAWCYTWDFTVAQGPFVGIYGNEQWVAGVGWQTQSSGNNQIGGPQSSPLFADSLLTAITVEWTNTGQDPSNNQYVGRTLNGGDYTYQMFPDQTTGNHAYTWNISASGRLSDYILVSLDCANLATRNTVKRITVYGLGVNPFGSSNCS